MLTSSFSSLTSKTTIAFRPGIAVSHVPFHLRYCNTIASDDHLCMKTIEVAKFLHLLSTCFSAIQLPHLTDRAPIYHPCPGITARLRIEASELQLPARSFIIPQSKFENSHHLYHDLGEHPVQLGLSNVGLGWQLVRR